MSAATTGGLRFVFYGRTHNPLPVKSMQARKERERQLTIAQKVVGGAGRIVIECFETRTHWLAIWAHRPKARRLLDALPMLDRPFDAIVVGDTRTVMSAKDFDNLTYLCALHQSQLWVPQIAGSFDPDRPSHHETMRRCFWESTEDNDGRDRLPSSDQARAFLPVGEPVVLMGTSLNGGVGLLLGSPTALDAANQPNSKAFVGMTNNESACNVGSDNAAVPTNNNIDDQAPVLWEVALANDGWRLRPATDSDRNHHSVVRVNASNAVPRAELQDAIRSAHAGGGQDIFHPADHHRGRHRTRCWVHA